MITNLTSKPWATMISALRLLALTTFVSSAMFSSVAMSADEDKTGGQPSDQKQIDAEKVNKNDEKNRNKKKEYRDGPTSDYEQIEVEGWKVFVKKRLRESRADIGDKALRIMRIQLAQLTTLVPDEQLADLKKVPIWLDDRPDGAAQYHPQRNWLVEHGYNPDKVKSVDVSQAERFVKFVFDQPYVMLHELAHAYHDRELSFDDPRVIDAYNNAVEKKKYEEVLKIQGNRGRHYALTNHKEYFAESTEAYFGTNDFYPFVRAELKEHDPGMYALLDEIWRGIPRKVAKAADDAKTLSNSPPNDGED